jgi:hypothetical protein
MRCFERWARFPNAAFHREFGTYLSGADGW